MQQIEAWNRGGGDVWLVSFGGEATTGFSPFQGIQEHRQGDFPFIKDLEIHQIQFRCIRCGARKGATNGHRKTSLLGLADLHSHVVLLDDHSRNDHQLGPVPLLVRYLAYVPVHQLHLPFLREKCCHGDHPQGRKQDFAIHQLENLFVTPEGLGELGINEKRAHGVGRWWIDVRSARRERLISRYQLFTNPKRNGRNPGRCLI